MASHLGSSALAKRHAARSHLAGLFCALLLFCTGRMATAQNTGFELNRFEPTTVGEYSFFVDHPWYSKSRYFAVGLTLNYAHDPYVFGLVSPDGRFTQTQSIIAHQLLSHVDIAGSFLDRVTIAASMPITLLERGRSIGDVTPVATVAVGDPRVGVMVRLFGQPDETRFSLSIGGAVWIPLRSFSDSLPAHASDSSVRVLPKLVAAGLIWRIRWSATAGFLYRPDASLGSFLTQDGSTTGSSLQIGLAASYADMQRRFAIGPELLLNSVLVGGHAFSRDYTSLELLLGAHYNFGHTIQFGLAGGLGLLREPGTPDARALFRVAYAPLPKPPPPPVDTDKDGIWDHLDACPKEKGEPTDDKRTNGCPPPDRDQDGVPDRTDLCPDQNQGDRPDLSRIGCPIPDRDRDDVLDAVDQCPDTAQGAHPDPKKLGCPDTDTDKDGVFDAQDECKTQPQTAHPDPKKPGCPDIDTDGDGVYDGHDKCLKTPATAYPDPERPGCPLPDQDGDSVLDKQDACPSKAGAPDIDPKKNGCPGLVQVRRGQIVILRAVFFNNDQDEVLKKSFPVLQAVANALIAQPVITKLAIEGHTDDRGDSEHNIDLSGRRANSVMRWLVEHGVSSSRLTAAGYGPDRPIADNKTLYGRAKNRRVEFNIVEPKALTGNHGVKGGGSKATPAPTTAPAPSEIEPAPAGEPQPTAAPPAPAKTEVAPAPPADDPKPTQKKSRRKKKAANP